jgi:hypothetical protein
MRRQKNRWTGGNGKIFCAVVTVALYACCVAGFAHAQGGKDQDMLNQGKVLMFDKKWEQARVAFDRFAGEFPRSPLLTQASFLSARCLQLQGREMDALQGYEAFLRKFPNETILQAEARNAVIEMAASLFEKGDSRCRDRLSTGMASQRKEVRYFAAIRCSRLKDARLSAQAVPVLREILEREKEPDLTNRARIALLRLQPDALAPKATQKSAATQKGRLPQREASQPPNSPPLLHLVVYREGTAKPVVELNVPVSLAQFAVAALDESAKAEMRRKGLDVENIWNDLKRLGPTDILTIRDGPKTVRIWIK